MDACYYALLLFYFITFTIIVQLIKFRLTLYTVYLLTQNIYDNKTSNPDLSQI